MNGTEVVKRKRRLSDVPRPPVMPKAVKSPILPEDAYFIADPYDAAYALLPEMKPKEQLTMPIVAFALVRSIYGSRYARRVLREREPGVWVARSDSSEYEIVIGRMFECDIKSWARCLPPAYRKGVWKMEVWFRRGDQLKLSLTRYFCRAGKSLHMITEETLERVLDSARKGLKWLPPVRGSRKIYKKSSGITDVSREQTKLLIALEKKGDLFR